MNIENNNLAILVLRYVYKHPECNSDEVVRHFKKKADVAITGLLFLLSQQYDYLRNIGGRYIATDKGAIAAEHELISRSEKRKWFFYGVMADIAVAVVGATFTYVIQVLIP